MSLPNPLPDTASSLFVRRLRLQAKIGDLGAADWNFRKQTMINEDPQAVQISQLDSLTGYLIGKIYSFSLLGFTVDYTTTAADTDLAGVATSIAARMNTDPNLRGQVTAAPSGNDVVITGNQPGAAFTLTALAECAATLTQSATSASEIPFGRLVLHKGYSSVAHRAADQLCRLADSNAFTAQADVVEVTGFDVATSYIVSILTDDGYRADFVVPANADAATTAGDIEAAIDADLVLASKGVTAAAVLTEVTITSATAGVGFQTTVSTSGGAGTIALTTDDYSIGTSLKAAAVGVSMQTYDDEQLTRGGDLVVYRPNDPVKVLNSGLIWVEIDGDETAPTFGGEVYVDLTPGDTAGRFYTVAGAGRSLLPGATWERPANNGTDLIGLVKIALY